MSSEDALIEAIENARTPRNRRLVERLASDPRSVKATSSMCARCEEKPCRDGELCASVIAHEADLLAAVGRDQAYQYVESGMERLELDDAAEVRTTDDERPNTFVDLSSR